MGDTWHGDRSSDRPTTTSPDTAARGGRPRREHVATGRPDYHNPLAGVGGAPPARSALTLRLVLAVFGLLFFGAGAVALALTGRPIGLVVAAGVVAAIATVNIGVVARRKHHGEPG